MLTNSNNLFKSNNTTNFNKKTHFKPTCPCIVRFTNTIQFIRYALMYQTIHEYLRYTLTMKLFVHNMIRITYRTTLKIVYIYISKLHSQKYINFVKMPLLRTNFLWTSDWFNKQILYEESPYKESSIYLS